MSEERKNLHLSGIGLLRPSDIGGEACEGCEHNQRGESCALVLGSGEALRSCAKLLFKDCELVPVGTKARIAELEELNELRKISIRLKEDLLECEVAMCDRLRKALQVIASGHLSGMVELVNTEEMKTVWKSDVGLPMTVSEARDIARKALKGAGDVEKDS